MTIHASFTPQAAAANGAPLERVDTPLGRTWRRFRRHKLAMGAAIVLILLAVLAVCAPYLAGQSPFRIDLMSRSQAPSVGHWLGTDRTGRDVFTRLLYAGRISLSVGLVAVAISTSIGILVGSLSGYYGGMVDTLLMRFTDAFMCFPTLLIIITLVAFVGASIYNTMIAIGIFSWPGVARLVRSQFLTLREQQFVLAARCIGARPRSIIFRHILPNAIAPIIVSATFGVAGAILTEASLSFLGLGVQAPTPSWGNMLYDARGLTILESMPWLWLPPGTMIAISVLAINFLGDGLRDALDPRMVFD